jgi:lipoyl(octanoyl) transferase
MAYEEALALQYDLQEKVQNGESDHLILLEHPKVITIGLNANLENILLSEQELIERGYSVKHIRRGGDVTYHGPGQIVGYLIFNLKKKHGGSIRAFVDMLEQTLIDVLFDNYGIDAHRDPINAGVFIGHAKIAAIGLSVSRGVTMHGFALNANTTLSDFSAIVPCGLSNRTVTSLAQILGYDVDLELLKEKLSLELFKKFNFENCLTDDTN